MVSTEPRSTWSHCGSLNALDQRVPVLPSTAEAAGVPTFSTDDAVASLPCESNVGAAWAEPGVIATISPAMRATTRVTRRDALFGFRAREGAIRWLTAIVSSSHRGG